MVSVYIVYTLEGIMFPKDDHSVLSTNYIVENAYNVVVLWLMCLSLLNFLYNDNRRSLLMFALCLSFGLSEIVQVPYMYLSEKSSLRISYSLLSFAGYMFIYFYIMARYNRRFKMLS